MKSKTKIIKAVIIAVLMLAIVGAGVGAYFIAQSNSNPNNYDKIQFGGDTFYVTQNLIDYEVTNIEGTTNEEYTLVMFMPPDDDTESWAEVLYKGDTDHMDKNQNIAVAFCREDNVTKFYNPSNELVMICDNENKLYDANNNYLGSFVVNDDGTVNCTDKDGNEISYSEMGEFLNEEVGESIKAYWDFYGGFYENQTQKITLG